PALHKGFIAQDPTQRKGRKGTVFLITAEATGTITAHGGADEITIFEAIIDSTQIGNQTISRGITGAAGDVGSYVKIRDFIAGVVASGNGIAFLIERLIGITCQDVDGMCLPMFSII